MIKGKYYKHNKHFQIVKCVELLTEKTAKVLVVKWFDLKWKVVYRSYNGLKLQAIHDVVCIEDYESYKPSFIELILMNFLCCNLV